MRIDEVVDRVLHPLGIPTRWELSQPLPVRSYITQYQESDLGFLRRLVREAGIYFWFDVDAGVQEALIASLDGVQRRYPTPLAVETITWSRGEPWYSTLERRVRPELEAHAIEPRLYGARLVRP